MRFPRPLIKVIKYDINGVPYTATVEQQPHQNTRAELWAWYHEMQRRNAEYRKTWQRPGQHGSINVKAVEQYHELEMLKHEV